MYGVPLVGRRTLSVGSRREEEKHDVDGTNIDNKSDKRENTNKGYAAG